MKLFKHYFILFFLILTFSSVFALQESVELNLSIAEYVSLELPDSIYMDVRVGTNKTMETEVSLRTNCQLNITIESSGFQEENAEILNDYIQYQLEGFTEIRTPSFAYGPFVVEPGTKYRGKLFINWLGESFGGAEWQSVSTGDYKDTITITISNL